jgi:sulfur-oxidizing protein SoxY
MSSVFFQRLRVKWAKVCALRLFALLAFTAAGLFATASAFAIGDSPSPSNGAWEYLRPQFYGTRDIGEVDESYMSLDAPANTPDPSATPLTLHFGKDAAGKIKQVRLIIDNNPSPLAATMDLKPGVPVDEIALRVRIDRFTSVRAIAETTDGRLEMRSTWVKASGGCSAPPSAAGGGTLGEIRLRPSADAKSLQMSIRHPNNSGFQIDPLSGDSIPPHYISHIRVQAAGATIIEADTGISLSENPTLRIASKRPINAPVTLEAVDSMTRVQYSGTWDGAPSKAAATGGSH